MANSVKFERPPVVEVVCGVQFDGFELNEIHLGRYFSNIEDRYELSSRQAPLPRLSDVSLPPQFQIVDVPDVPRLWFAETDGPYLLQIQSNRFLLNWRKPSDGTYPGFYQGTRANPGVCDRFLVEWSNFKKYCEDAAGRPLRVTGCELSYIDHLTQDEHFPSLAELKDYITLFKITESFENLNQFGLNLGFIKNEIPVRLVVRRAKRQLDAKDLLTMEYTAVQASDAGLDVTPWFAKANDLLTSEFVKHITPKAKEEWGLTDV